MVQVLRLSLRAPAACDFSDANAPDPLARPGSLLVLPCGGPVHQGQVG